MYSLNCVYAATASLFIEFFLVNSVQRLENVRLHPTKVRTIGINGTLSCSLLVMYAPAIWPYQALILLNVRRVIKNLLRGGESRTFIELAASTAILDTLPQGFFLLLTEPEPEFAAVCSRNINGFGGSLAVVVEFLGLAFGLQPWLIGRRPDGAERRESHQASARHVF